MQFGRRSPLNSNSFALFQNSLNGGSVLIICLSHSWGGLEQVAASDTLELVNTGVSVKVLVFNGSPLHEKVLKCPGVEVIALRFTPRNFCDLKLRAELIKILSQGVSLVHTHQTTLLGSIVPWMLSHRQVGLIATRHMMSNHYKKDFFHQALYSRVDALVVVSEAIRANVLATHSIQGKKVKVIRLGLDFDQFDLGRVDPTLQKRLWGVAPDTQLIGLVGRIDPAKGQATFIKAAAGLIGTRRDRPNLKFVIVGEETRGAASGYLEELKSMVRQFGLEDLVLFTGYQENIPQVMSALDIVVMPSQQEAFGLVAIEAMAMQCPVLISKGGSAEEIVGNEDYGLLVRPDDAFDLQRQLRFCLDRPEVRVEMGRKAREHVQAWYDRKKRLVNTLNLYERVLRRRRQSEQTVRVSL
jgi:glycosyltransferase involved in cell wall biosynthesis